MKFPDNLIWLQGFGYLNCDEILTIRFGQQSASDGWQNYVILLLKNGLEMTGLSTVRKEKVSINTSELRSVKDWEYFLEQFDFSRTGYGFLLNYFR